MVATATPIHAENLTVDRTTQARDAKRLKVRQLLNAQDVFLRDLNDQNLKPIDRVNAMRAWDIAEERIRILRGKVKPGSRNISVREPHPSELKQRQLARPPATEDLSALYRNHVADQVKPIVTPPPATPTE